MQRDYTPLATPADNKVIVHIYDLTPINDKFYPVGLGIFHSGVEINGKEYWFFGHQFDFTGVIGLEPGIESAAGMVKRESTVLGTTTLRPSQIDGIITELTSKYTGVSYHPIMRNCNHFSEELCIALLGKPIPGYINRLAKFANFITKLVPESWLWWILTKVLGEEEPDPVVENNTAVPVEQHPDEVEVCIDGEQIEVDLTPDPFQEFLMKASKEDPSRQREIATEVFMHVNRGNITFQDVRTYN